jgi:hypothetical protein
VSIGHNPLFTASIAGMHHSIILFFLKRSPYVVSLKDPCVGWPPLCNYIQHPAIIETVIQKLKHTFPNSAVSNNTRDERDGEMLSLLSWLLLV